MNDKKKLNLILIIAIVSILTILGVTYAFYNYTRTGENNKLIAGEVYLRYIETNQMTLNNAIPETKTSAFQKNDNIFYFKIEGKNTSTNDIFYDIIISHGDSQTGKSRLKDNHIRIYLERDGVTLIDGEIFDDWDNPVIYTDKMPALTNSHTVFNYELRMWVDEDVTISDTDPTADYDTATWNNSYASLKLHVNSGGVFENAQPASCFTYDVLADDGIVGVGGGPIITYNFSAENVAKCQQFVMNYEGEDRSDAQDGYKSYCEGTGTTWYGSFTLEDDLLSELYGSLDEVIPQIGVVESYDVEELNYYALNTSEESINACRDFMMENEGEDTSNAKDEFLGFCMGNDVLSYYVNIFQVFQDTDTYIRDEFIKLNVFTPIVLDSNNSEIRILDYDVNTCGTDVSIPSYINGLPVTTIGCMDDSCLEGIVGSNPYAFTNKGINTVKLPATLKYIGKWTFDNANLTSIVIPNNVVSIESSSFRNNNITDLMIPSSVVSIGQGAFYGNPFVNVVVQGSPTVSWSAFDNNGESTFLSFNYGGTCSELQSYSNIFNSNHIPQTIITSDSNSCAYSG